MARRWIPGRDDLGLQRVWVRRSGSTHSGISAPMRVRPLETPRVVDERTRGGRQLCNKRVEAASSAGEGPVRARCGPEVWDRACPGWARSTSLARSPVRTTCRGSGARNQRLPEALLKVTVGTAGTPGPWHHLPFLLEGRGSSMACTRWGAGPEWMTLAALLAGSRVRRLIFPPRKGVGFGVFGMDRYTTQGRGT